MPSANFRVALTAALCASFCAMAGFAPPARAATETVIYSFQNNRADGYFPAAALTEADGVLYGTTANGGRGGCYNGCGTVFSVDPATGAETVLYSFGGKTASQPGSLVAKGGRLFGSTAGAGHYGDGSLFSIDLSTGGYDRRYSFCSLYDCSDGSSPNPGLIDGKGVLYGMTSSGGRNVYDGNGVAFSFDPKTGAETPIYAFCSHKNCSDGSDPTGGLLRIKGRLYGATDYGGKGGLQCGSCGGVVFRINPGDGKESVLYAFCSEQNCADGSNPQGSLTALNGLLYGVTAYGGGSGDCSSYVPGCGIVFSIDPASGAETVLYAFQQNGQDALEPTSSLVELNGLLYGVTETGGAKGDGAVYSVDPSIGAETVVYSFCSQTGCADGARPEGGLVNINGVLYGATTIGGTGACAKMGCGAVYAITP